MRSYVSWTKQHSTRLRPGTESGRTVKMESEWWDALTTLGVCGVYWLPWFSIISEAQWRLLINGFKESGIQACHCSVWRTSKVAAPKGTATLVSRNFFRPANSSGSAAPYQGHRGPPRATLPWCRRPEHHYLGQRVSTRKDHTLRGHQQES